MAFGSDPTPNEEQPASASASATMPPADARRDHAGVARRPVCEYAMNGLGILSFPHDVAPTAGQALASRPRTERPRQAAHRDAAAPALRGGDQVGGALPARAAARIDEQAGPHIGEILRTVIVGEVAIGRAADLGRGGV